jgi:hypothetical protein
MAMAEADGNLMLAGENSRTDLDLDGTPDVGSAEHLSRDLLRYMTSQAGLGSQGFQRRGGNAIVDHAGGR